MIRYGKTSQTAISAMSLLAEVFDSGRTKLSSQDIATRRNLPQPVVAKVLSQLSTRGLVDGSRGPGGGYFLATHPSKISLMGIVECFERSETSSMCPFGPNWCGRGAPCPMHDHLLALDGLTRSFLSSTTLSVFLETQRPVVQLGDRDDQHPSQGEAKRPRGRRAAAPAGTRKAAKNR